MIGFVLTGHGSFPEGILQSVELIAGEIAQVAVVPFKDDTDKLEKELVQAINQVNTGSGVVCFADLAGGTPFNIVSRIAVTQEAVHVLGGTNLPMLISGVFQRELSIDDLVKRIMEEGKDNIKLFESKKRDPTKHIENGI